MYRTDGYRVHTNDPMYEIVPHVMAKRHDACNSITQEIELDPMQNYIIKCRKKGISMSHMSILIAGYLRVASQNPNLNRFCVNKRIYARNHFCVSFVTLTPGKSGDTVNKVYFNLDDTILTVNEKINNAIEKSKQSLEHTSMDKLAARLLKIPFLLRLGVSLIKFFDWFFTVPFSIVDASPFHTSLFVTNLASIRTNAIYHHLYDFGTTGVFAAMGQPEKKAILNGETLEYHKVMGLGIVTDERIANGHYYSRCFKELKRYYKNPELLETPPEKVVWDPDVNQKKFKFFVK